MSNEDIGTIVKTGLVLIAFFVGLYYLASGVSLFGAADYFKDPVQAFQNQTAGVLQIGVGATILLVTIGGVAAVAALLRFIARVSDR